MKRIAFPFLLLSSLSWSALSAAPVDKISGSIFIDSQFPFEPDTLSDNLLVSRARLDFKGSWSDKFSYKVRIERPAYSVNDTSSVVIPVAFVTYSLYDDLMKLNVGRDAPRYSQAGTDAQSYIERSLGVLEDNIGKKIGANISGVYNKSYGYSLGLWSTTARASITDYSYSLVPIESDLLSTDDIDANSVTFDGTNPIVSFNAPSNRFAVGGRLNAVVIDRGLFSYGIGAGLQSLDVIVPLVTQYDNSGTLYHTTFEKRVGGTIDQSFGWRNFVLNSAFHYFKYYRDNETSTPKNEVPADLNAFQRKNQASSFYVELEGLVIGERYQIDPATGVVNKIVADPNYGSLELAVRMGTEYYYNAAGVQYIKGTFNDTDGMPITFTKHTGYNQAVINEELEEDFIVRVKGWTLSSSYAVNSAICLKAEYYHIKTSSKANGIWTTLEKEQGLRFRSEFSF